MVTNILDIFGDLDRIASHGFQGNNILNISSVVTCSVTG